MKKVYIVLAHTGTILSRIIRMWTGDEYTHASIALDEELNEMYSFGRKNAYIAFIGGFVREGIKFGTFKRFYKSEIGVYELEVTDEQYDKVCETIKNIKEHKDNYVQVLRLSIADLKKTYHGAALGWLWAIVKPVVSISRKRISSGFARRSMG